MEGLMRRNNRISTCGIAPVFTRLAKKGIIAEVFPRDVIRTAL
jgi:hypothetical protein